MGVVKGGRGEEAFHDLTVIASNASANLVTFSNCLPVKKNIQI